MVIVFSNLAQITNVAKDHPVKKELAKGERFKLETCLTRKVTAASNKTMCEQEWRAKEEVELWVLVNK